MTKTSILPSIVQILQRFARSVTPSLPFWGAGLVLIIGILSMTSLSIDRTRANMTQALGEKGTALLQAFERTLGSHRRRPNTPPTALEELRAQSLLEALADRNDVRFMAIVSPDGIILGHSNPARIGQKLTMLGKDLDAKRMTSLNPGSRSQWLRTDMEAENAFVVYRFIRPTFRESKERDHGGRHGRRFERGGQNENVQQQPILFLGLDPKPLNIAQARNRQWALTIMSVILASSVLMMLMLYAVQRLRTSRRSQREAEALTKKLALTLPDGLILLDTRGRIMHMNKTALDLIEVSKDPTGIKASEVLPPSLLAIIKRLSTEETLANVEIPFLSGDTERTLNIRGGNMNDPDIGRTGSLLLIRDVSEMRHLEAELRRREKMVALGKLAAGVAHELRNPLSSIKGYATYFGQLFPKGSDEQKGAELMVDEVERMGRAITDLINLSRPSDIRPQLCDLRLLADEALRLIQQDANSRNVKLCLDAAPVLPEALVDPDRMRQVLLNLCLNALEAMPEGGTLTLRLHSEILNEEEGFITLTVSDTGLGIALEDQARVFDPYFTTKGQGTGLGLATVVSILEAHEAHIRLESTEGEGTIFYVRIPLPPSHLEQIVDTQDPKGKLS